MFSKKNVDRLENTHSNILELLPEKEYDAGFEVVEDFWDKANRIQTKARRIINGQQNVSSVLNSTNDDSVVINSVGNVVVDNNQVDEVVLNKRIKYRQQMITDIQKRFRSEYLGLLFQRNENKKLERSVKLGGVVLIGSDNVNCSDRPLG
ncbi:integrase catalytic domain-containing protein [Nephila pilipes]|uniref:Integrase catalytic domain-containing protein n=1 Tax=Nephila pilipes TaxID=299642 RepID=A0A8X6NQP3_NEPPI|nr:integrase catalytic domain-containing protein [Nephila pilipes]